MAEEKTRVDFNAPETLVERADQVAEVLDISRTRLLIDALEDELEELAADDAFRRRLSDAYYDGRIDYSAIEGILGREEALRIKLLKDSLDRAAPEPRLVERLPTDEEFYDSEAETEFSDEQSAADDGQPS